MCCLHCDQGIRKRRKYFDKSYRRLNGDDAQCERKVLEIEAIRTPLSFSKHKTQGSKATENAKHEARGSEATKNASSNHEARGRKATKNVSVKHKA